MLDNRRDEQRSWWKRVLTGILAIVFGLCAIAFPTGIMFGRILDVIFGQAKRYGSMAADWRKTRASWIANTTGLMVSAGKAYLALQG